MTERFEIRVEEASEQALEFGMDYPLHVVWDNQRGRGVPFGRYRSHSQAELRLARERAKVVQQKTEGAQ